MNKPQPAENVAPVQTVGCSWCDAEPGEECIGEGVGWHLSRWDRLHDTAPIPPASTDGEVAR